VVAETDIKNRNYLTIIDAFDGSVLQQMHTGDRAVITPDWAEEDEIIMITVSSRGKQLESVNLSTGVWTVYITFTLNDINDPVSYGDFILFRGTSENTENIFAIERKSPGKIFRLTNSEYGTRHPSVSNDKRNLLFSVYTAKGFDVSKIALDTARWEPVISIQTGDEFASELADTNSYRWNKAKTYNKAEHLFRIHSWLPFHTDIDAIQDNPVETGLYPGFMIFSQNLLGTAISSISYSYKDGYHKIYPVFAWRGWYPVIQLRGEIGGTQQILSLPEGRSVPEDASPFVRLSIKTFVPLVFNRGAFSLFIRPEMEYEFSSTWFNHNEDLKSGLGLLHLRFTASNYRRMSVRDLYPVWGQSVAATYSATLSDKDPFGYLYSAQVSLFFPGIARHHHFYLIAGHQLQEPERYYLPYARVNFPRGYPERISGEFTSMLLNYSFPVVYPDLSLGPVIYLKRIRTNLFYDIGYGSKVVEYRPGPVVTSGWYNSVGSEIMADFHAFRFIFPVAAGVRLGYRRDQTRPFAELLVRINTSL